MLIKTVSGLYQSTLLSSIGGVVHGYTSRMLGDMKKNQQNRQKVLDELFGKKVKFVTAEQVHGEGVTFVNDATTSSFSGVDGLVYKHKAAEVVALGVFVADCVPMLLVDPKAEIIAAIHAGWRGTLGGITTNTIREMKKLGSNPKDIMVWVGPHIGMCHYDVPQERAHKFRKMFGNDPKVASFFENAWHADIGWVNFRQLIAAGIQPDHIDAPPTCTSCQNDEFFSYRKDAKETYGEMMAVIGFR